MLFLCSVVVDTDGEKCVVASFVLGAQSIAREYEIRVLQYDKQNELGGPSGCLQYFIDDKETVTTFNWGSGKVTVLCNRDATALHTYMNTK